MIKSQISIGKIQNVQKGTVKQCFVHIQEWYFIHSTATLKSPVIFFLQFPLFLLWNSLLVSSTDSSFSSNSSLHHSFAHISSSSLLISSHLISSLPLLISSLIISSHLSLFSSVPSSSHLFPPLLILSSSHLISSSSHLHSFFSLHFSSLRLLPSNTSHLTHCRHSELFLQLGYNFSLTHDRSR